MTLRLLHTLPEPHCVQLIYGGKCELREGSMEIVLVTNTSLE